MNRQYLFPNDLLIEWFEAQKRPLPWRESPSPYRVWVSEVMLQQTRASVVISYFERWMQHFPNIASLASAPLEQVIKMWEGLGYYSRARNLHRGAQQCVAQFQGELPADEKDLASIKGIGPYTLAALLNFAFRKRKPLIDGNVLRVLSRFFAIESPIDTPSTYALIEELLDQFLPEEKYWVVSEALMELGALICTKEAHCDLCPLQKHCAAKKNRLEKILPLRKPRTKTISLLRVVALVSSGEKIALKKGESGKIMADLYEFPYIECSSEEEGVNFFIRKKGWEHEGMLCTAKHHFTRYKASLFAHIFFAENKDEEWIWVDKDKLLELPFSSGHRRILERYLENTTYRSLPWMGRARNENLE